MNILGTWEDCLYRIVLNPLTTGHLPKVIRWSSEAADASEILVSHLDKCAICDHHATTHLLLFMKWQAHKQVPVLRTGLLPEWGGFVMKDWVHLQHSNWQGELASPILPQGAFSACTCRGHPRELHLTTSSYTWSLEHWLFSLSTWVLILLPVRRRCIIIASNTGWSGVVCVISKVDL